MRKLFRTEKINNKRGEFTFAAQACPRCGNASTRRSLKKINDGLLKILFCKFYRCNECRYRFSVMNPMRMVLLSGIVLVLIFVIGALWMGFNEQAAVADSAQTVADDPIKSLAEQGDAESELKMGLRYASIAWGVKDDKTAALWFEKAARHNQVEAQYRYGWALLKGLGVVQDYKAAFYWLEKAAQQGNSEAQLALGEIYHSGIGIKPDTERAYLWFNLAAAQGVDSAASARDLVVQLLTPDQIAAMQAEAGRISRSQHSVIVEMPKAKVNEPVSAVVEMPQPLKK